MTKDYGPEYEEECSAIHKAVNEDLHPYCVWIFHRTDREHKSHWHIEIQLTRHGHVVRTPEYPTPMEAHKVLPDAIAGTLKAPEKRGRKTPATITA